MSSMSDVVDNENHVMLNPSLCSRASSVKHFIAGHCGSIEMDSLRSP